MVCGLPSSRWGCGSSGRINPGFRTAPRSGCHCRAGFALPFPHGLPALEAEVPRWGPPGQHASSAFSRLCVFCQLSENSHFSRKRDHIALLPWLRNYKLI